MEKMDNDCYIAHKYSSNHRAELEKDRICGCFEMYPPSFYIRYTPEEQKEIYERDKKKIRELLDEE
jgi:hypothetical protein